jgi:hypothetical protein
LIDTQNYSIRANIKLPNGSVSLRGVAISPDSRYAFVSHVLGRSRVPATQLEQGWLNTNAVSIIDLEKKECISTVLLDQMARGAANPWGISLTPDGGELVVALAGVHQLAVIHVEPLLKKLQGMGPQANSGEYRRIGRPDTDLTFLDPFYRRVALKGRGPRPVLARGGRVYVGSYFSGSVESIDLANAKAPPRQVSLGEQPAETETRRGERLFHDATLSFQGWQSCSTCHVDGRSDGLNWDLTNDGVGTTKNTKSLLFSYATPPVTWTGVFPSINECVPHELRTILFASRPAEDAAAMVEYLKSLRPVPSPLGDRTITIDVPTLREVWRTAPYLHDGRASSVKDIFLNFNPERLHGKTGALSTAELDDMIQFVLSQ